MKRPTLRQAEWATAILLTLVVISLMVVRALHAGGLWRDECAAVQLARMPTFTDIAKNFQYEAFPLLFPTMVRGYTNVFGTSDIAFRMFGLAVGVLLLAVLWFNAWQLGGEPPLLSLALLGLNTSVLVWGTSVRGYGLGMVLILLVFGLIGKALLEPTRLRLVATFVAAFAAVHCLLYNSILLAAIGGSAIVISWLRGKRKLTIVLIGISAVCAASVMPYVGPYSSGRDWDVLVKSQVGLTQLWKQLDATMGAPVPFLGWVWQALLLAVAAGNLWFLRRPAKDRSASGRDWQWFGLLSLLLAVVGYFIFLKVLSYRTYAWYYLALVAVLAAVLELLAVNLSSFGWVRTARLGLALVAVIIVPFAAWPKLTTRQTNTDLVAHMLEQNAKAGDLVVVTPWFHGVSFNWYYRGAARWVTLPLITEHRTHRYGLLKEKMTSPNPIEDVRGLVAQTLQAGGRVWFVGDIFAPSPGMPPLVLPPAPDPRIGWNEGLYEMSWIEQMVVFMQQHAPKWGTVKLPITYRVSELEDVTVFMAEGWK